MRYRFNVDLRTGQKPPEDGFVPSDPQPRPAPQVQDLVPTEQLEAVYRRLARQVTEARLGRTDAQHVFSARGYKHLLVGNAQEVVTELRLSIESGSLVRRVYERMGGESQSLADLMERGLSGLDADEVRFGSYPGYELRFTRYSVRESRLARVRMGRIWFHPEHQGIVTTPL